MRRVTRTEEDDGLSPHLSRLDTEEIITAGFCNLSSLVAVKKPRERNVRKKKTMIT